MLKKATRTLMDDFSALAEDTSQLVIQVFQVVPYANILDLARQVGYTYAVRRVILISLASLDVVSLYCITKHL